MARTIPIAPEWGNPTPRTARDPSTPLRHAVGHPRRGFGYGDTQGPSTSLGMTGLGRGLTGRAGCGALGAWVWLRQHARSLDFARDDRTWEVIDNNNVGGAGCPT